MARKPVLAIGLAATALIGIPTTAAFAGDRGDRYERYYQDDDDDEDDDRYERRGRRYYEPRSYYGRNYRYYGEPRYRCRSKGTTGLIVGGAAGALLGSRIAGRGSGTTGALIGGAAGALLGREVARKDRC